MQEIHKLIETPDLYHNFFRYYIYIYIFCKLICNSRMSLLGYDLLTENIKFVIFILKVGNKCKLVIFSFNFANKTLNTKFIAKDFR